MRKNGTPSRTVKTRAKHSAAIGLLPLCLGWLALAAPSGTHAETPAASTDRGFDIAPQPLYSALSALAEQSGVQFVYNSEMVKGISSPGVSGRYSVEGALKRLLAGSGIGYRFNSGNTVTLEKIAVVEPQSSTLMPAVTVTGKSGYADSDPYNPNYNRASARTATKTDTPIMETPMSIQVVPRAVMNDQKSVTIKDALENVSSVRPQPTLGNDVGFLIRGFRQPKFFRNGLVANGTNANFPSFFDTANLERMEVLKGPASILFGRIEPGGLINLSTKKPLDTPYYSVEQQFGSYNFYRTQWDATGPVTKDGELLYRFNGSHLSSNSFRDFVFKDRTMADGSITWRPTDATDFTVEVEGIDQDYQADFGIPVVGTRPASIPISRTFSDPNDPVDHASKVNLNTELTHRLNDSWVIHNRFLMQRTNSEETFINPAPAFGNALNEATGDLQRNVFFQSQDTESYATNLDLTGKFQLGVTKHEILVGYDYLRSFTKYHTQGFYDTANAALNINIYNPGPSYGIEPSVFGNAVSTTESFDSGSNFSVFKDEWHGAYFQDHIILWDKVHILGGGRYDWTETGRAYRESFAAANEAVENSSPSILRKDAGFSPRVGILYQPLDWLSVYGNWTTSFGANNGISSTGASFDPQIGEQFETGFKTEWFDKRLSTTVAYYHLSKENLLTPDLTTPDPNDSVALGKQRSQGIELDVAGQLSEELSLIGNYAYTDARIIADNRTLNGQLNGYEGKRMPNVPEHAGSLWLKYDIKRNELFRGLSFGIGAYAAGQQEGDNEGSFQLPGYVRLDAFTAYQWKVGDSKLTAQFNIRNLLDKTYYESTDPNLNLSPRLGVYPGSPLFAMGSIRLEY
ncbi:TonB-dependent siderophore receptor [Methylomonas rivi]|uniref:TonB-dependent siderophore receptor n=1 Tax=Methylomonas rivi TaxID=2952226 RepID=A0ABT1U9L2_9GAMM|nr:TonB-dependent siderophore receptor [Methylomonas sp. WSC-6]MCQ8130545.1 TonB-dependent siderophore receptor [Methylomonas sp. WSC-6]